MSDDPGKMREDARRRLLGRAMVIGMLLLAALYAWVTLVR
jgi:hypothetical protein